MININIPELMEDELLYSFLIRISEDNSLPVDEFAVLYVRNDIVPVTTRRAYRLPTGNTIYIPKIASILDKDPQEFYLRTSIHSGLAPLQNQVKQSRIINIAFRKTLPKYSLLAGRPQPDIPQLKYCPVCHYENITGHGFTWLRRAHHMPGVNVCWKHGVKLGNVSVDHNAVSGQLIFPVIVPEESSEEEIQFAVFAKEFLEAHLDTDRNTLIKILTDELEQKNGRGTLLKEVRRGGRGIDAGRLLRWLFEVFRNVSSIPARRNEDLYERFSASSTEYDLLSGYSSTCITMRKKGEDESFVTTPWGFLAGWRSPSDDCCDEQEKITQVVHNVRNGEYEPAEPVTSMDKPMKFLHKPCGEMSLIRPWDLIENGVSCFCQKKSAKNIHYARKRVEDAGNFKLLSVSDDMILKIRAIDCGHEFEVKALSWYTNPVCRVCMKNNPYITADEEFRKKVTELVGDEYEVTGRYITRNSPVDIYHKRCKKTTSYMPDRFLHGSRCECDTKEWIPKGKEFRRYVHDRSSGLYEITGYDKYRNCIIRNTKTGEEMIMGRLFIIQELERPTKSDVLPVEAKGEFIADPMATDVGKVKKYLEDNYKPGDLFDWGQIPAALNMTNDQITSILSNLMRKSIVRKAKNRKRFFIFIGKADEQIDDADPFEPGHEFRLRVKDLVGDEYKVIGDYVDWNTPVEMLHEVCKNSFLIKPADFAAGVRCSCLPKPPYGNAFIDYVRDRSCGLYEVRRQKSETGYIVRNTETGEEKSLPKMRIIQELERPTPSPVLPLEKKGSYDYSQSITNIDRVMRYLNDVIGPGTEFNMSELRNTGLSVSQVGSIVQRLRRSGIILPVDGNRGHYIFHPDSK